MFGVLNTLLYFPSGAVYPQQGFPGWMQVIAVAESGITKVYDRWAADPEKAEAMERWANRLWEIVG